MSTERLMHRSYLRKPANWPVALGMAILWLLGRLPFPFNVKLGKFVGRLLFYVPSSRKHVALTNLKLCFPELTEEELQDRGRQAMENYVAGLVETALAWWSSPERIYRWVEIEGLDILHQAQAQNKGVILVGAHFSTLDIGAALARKYFRFSVVYRQQKNSYFDAVMLAARNKHSDNVIPKTELRRLVKTIRQKEVVWYSPDQDDGEKSSVYAPFFGQTAATITGTTTLVRLTGAPVLMYGQRRKEDDSGYVLSITGPLENFPTGDEVADATTVNKLIETQILRAPAQYYWMHRRFKTQPNMERGALYRKS